MFLVKLLSTFVNFFVEIYLGTKMYKMQLRQYIQSAPKIMVQNLPLNFTSKTMDIFYINVET